MVVFDGRLHVHYGQAYVFSGEVDDSGDVDACFRGQTNGLLGAAKQGQLFLITGLHIGEVRFRLETADAAPPLDEAWEECVEASFRPEGDVQVVDWDGRLVCAVPLGPQIYRVPINQYALTFWPAPEAPDAVINQTSALANYWHRWARGL
jgi:hypothetical protein